METGSGDVFNRSGTIGIEEEFFIVNDAGRPVSGIQELIYDSEPPAILQDRLDHELFQCTIETQTPIIEEPGEAESTLLAIREALTEHAEAHGFQIAAAGLHPAAKWQELDHATKPRYQAQLDRIQYPQHRNTTSGLHVHIGVDDADKAVWIANELRWYLPPLLALSANSPYWNGFDTGLASARAKIFENLPNTGIPTQFADFEAYDRFEQRMVDHGAINDRGELWFDVRPHTGLGTVEVRTPDAQSDPEIVLAFVEYVHALVADLAARYEDGEAQPQLRRELLDENKWQAIRHGHEATFISRDGEGTIDLAAFVDRECDRLGVDGLRSVFERDSGSQRQRQLIDEKGMDALCDSLLI
ncbi:glutamate--cysteine ligase [Halonotius roseus]|uniref:Glutamate--cysteine ligase n=1 Tax=Halonotius roseus TaxID=2511997 RepID=A0A544QLT0_9EURY|nr:glutamate--cysteine ligase [Halonotius roseus]TQQ79545.1 glutamate--cysteine ligase [Halonotius roseus]